MTFLFISALFIYFFGISRAGGGGGQPNTATRGRNKNGDCFFLLPLCVVFAAVYKRPQHDDERPKMTTRKKERPAEVQNTIVNIFAIFRGFRSHPTVDPAICCSLSSSTSSSQLTSSPSVIHLVVDDGGDTEFATWRVEKKVHIIGVSFTKINELAAI